MRWAARIITCVFAYAHCWEYFVTMKLLQLSTNSSGVLFVLLELVLCLLPRLTAFSRSSRVKLDVISVTNTTNVLQRYLCGTNDQQIPNNTVIELVSPSYVLDGSRLCLVSNRHNIAIVSKQQANISCTTKTGLGFVNVSVLNISNIQIQGCGASILPLAVRIGSTTGPYLSKTSHASLAIVDSNAVSLSSVTITKYFGYAILVVNVYGASNLSNLNIDNHNNIWRTFWNSDRGSGVMVYYHNSSKPASLNIFNSQFTYNQLFASSVCLPELLSPLSHSTPIPTPHASALSVVYNQVSQNVSVTLYNSLILSNTGSPVVLILYYDSLLNVTTVINSTAISNNQGTISKCHGTGFAMVTYFSKYFTMKYEESHKSNTSDWTSLSISQTLIDLSIFNGERQSVLYLSTTQINQLMVHVVFQNVRFQYNSAAEVVYAETIMTLGHENITSLAVHFIDVVADGNIQNRVTKGYWYMPGAILTFVEVAAVYLSDSNFTHNVGSVIEAFNTDVYMSGNVIFQYNSGSNGAALLLLGQSYLFLYPNLSADFEYNTYKYGGAIYSFSDKISDDSYCTFQVLSNNLSEVTQLGPRLSFVANIANIGHISVSAISIDDCQQIQLDINPRDLYEIIFHFENDYIIGDYSTPARIMPCVNGNPLHNFSNTISTSPGEKINISLAALDFSGANIATSVQVKLYHGQNYQSLQPSSWWLSDCEKEQILESSATCTNISLTIHTKEVNSNRAISTALLSFPGDVPTFQSEIILKQCPPGFQLNDNSGICECNPLIKTMNQNFRLDITCDIQDSVINVPNLDAWIGCYNNSGEHCEVVGISPSCFPGLCNYSSADSHQWISGSASICIDSREGALCSSCAHGYSVVFGSNQCQQCSNWWLFTIFIYAIAGLLLVAFLFAFKLTASTGTFNGFIFFGNMWNSGPLEILTHHSQSVWATFSSKFVSFLNLGLVYPLCFYDGMTELAKNWLQLVFPVYLLVLVALVVIVSRYSMRVSSLVYSRAVPVLVTVVYFSLSGIFLTFIDVISVGYIYTANHISTVWLRDGNVPYFSLQHVALMIVSSILAAVFILPYLILLVGAQWWIKFKAINLYFKPIIDAVHGPYKDNMYYWFSLRLILLLQQMVVYAALRGVQGWILYSVNGPILIAFTILHTSARPFKSKAVNILDGLMMLAICLVVYGCSALYDHQYTVTVTYLSLLVVAVFLIFLVILSYHVLLSILMYCRSKSLFAEKAFQYLASFIVYDTGTPDMSYQPINNERQPIPQFREPLLDVSYGST